MESVEMQVEMHKRAEHLVTKPSIPQPKLAITSANTNAGMNAFVAVATAVTANMASSSTSQLPTLAQSPASPSSALRHASMRSLMNTSETDVDADVDVDADADGDSNTSNNEQAEMDAAMGTKPARRGRKDMGMDELSERAEGTMDMDVTMTMNVNVNLERGRNEDVLQNHDHEQDNDNDNDNNACGDHSTRLASLDEGLISSANLAAALTHAPTTSTSIQPMEAETTTTAAANAAIITTGTQTLTSSQIMSEGDSIDKIITELEQLMQYIRSMPRLSNSSASFVRDYLRTLIAMSQEEAQACIDAANVAAAVAEAKGQNTVSLNSLPDDLLLHIFSFLDGDVLSITSQVSRKWRLFGRDPVFWKALCLQHWPALNTDPALWPLVVGSDFSELHRDTDKWRKIYPQVSSFRSWKIRLQKTGRFVCNMIAHQIRGRPLADNGIPETLIVERRFNVLHLETFVLPDSPVLYFEPATSEDRERFVDFIEYLTKRTRAGLALDDQRRFIFIPPCEYASETLKYEGTSLLGVVQIAYPPLQS